MPDGEMRRPPQLWEQRLARTTSLLGVGLSSSGDATAIVTPTPPPGSGGGTEPAPVLPPPGAFIKPSTPQLIGSVQAIKVLWDGLNSAGDLWPYDTSFLEVHMSTAGTGFTPGTATLQGRLARPGGLTVGGLTAGTTYHFRFVGADPAGNVTEPSDAASGQTGLTTSSDYGTATIGSGAVSFNARQIGGVTNTVGAVAPSSPLLNDVWLDSSPGTAIIHKIWNGSTWVTNAWGSASIAAGQVTALQIAAGAVTAGAIAAGAITADKIQAGAITTDKLTAGTITGFVVSGGTVTGNLITGATVEGSSFRTATSGARVELGASFGALSGINFFSSTASAGGLVTGLNAGEIILFPGSGGRVTINGPTLCNSTFQSAGKITGDGAMEIIGSNVDLPGCVGNAGATTGDAGFNGNRLRQKSSTQRLKYDIATVDGTLTDVDPERQIDVVTVNPHDLLDVAVAEFSWLEQGEPTQWRELGFIAEDVAAKFPIAASIGPDGLPMAVRDTPILAALLAVVREQQATITDLRTRIEALEA